MFTRLWRSALLILPFVVTGCDTGPYDPAAHHHEDASTGSLIPGGNQTGPGIGGNIGDPALNSNLGAGRGR